MKLLLLGLLILFNGTLFRFLDSWPYPERLVPYVWESDAFRAMRLGPSVSSMEDVDCELLALSMYSGGFDLTAGTLPPALLLHGEGICPPGFGKLADAYRMIFDDLECFPVPKPSNPEIPDISYTDGWMEKRSYGGERRHEGCDLMGDQMPRGFYPVISMTDGVVEHVGWLPMGGLRLGVRAPSGAYFYYAHLSEYAKEWQEGEPIAAGELIGYMGDTGYGEEGTTGQFPVHLHLGIYIRTDHYDELSVNPYWILKYMEKRRGQFTAL